MMMCRDVSELTTEDAEGALTGWRKLRYRFHLTICPFCRAHKRQVDTTIQTLGKLASDTSSSEEQRTRALEAFRHRTKNSV